MPYPGIKPGSKNETQMESCVKDLMADSKMKDKYPDPKERKNHSVAICHASIVGKEEVNTNMPEDIEKAVWTTATIDKFPDSSFAYVSPGGKKDSEGKTVPRSLRHLPYKDANGKIDAAHVRNALARLNQTNIPASAKASAHAKLVVAAKQVGIEVSEKLDYSELEKLFSKGGEQIMTDGKKIEEIDTTKKADDTRVESAAKVGETVVDENKEETVKDSSVIDKGATEEKVEEVEVDKENKDEVVKEDKPVEEVVVEEVKEEAKEEVKEEVKEEPKTEEATEEEIAKKGKPGDACTLTDGTKGKLTPDKDGKLVCVVASKPTEEAKVDVAETTKVSFDELSKKLDELINLVKKAPAEGASDKETPKEEVAVEANKEEVAKVETTVEEKPAEEPKVEETVVEKVETKDTSSEEASKELLEKIDSLTKRIEELEKSPAPSKVVFSKSFVGDEEGKTLDLAKVDSRLAEIAKIRDGNPQGYTDKLREEALDLIKQKKALQVF